LDFTVTKCGDDQIQGFIGFFDPQNLGEDTKIISLVHFVEEIDFMLWQPLHAILNFTHSFTPTRAVVSLLSRTFYLTQNYARYGSPTLLCIIVKYFMT